MWKDPVYRFRVSVGTDANGNELLREVVINVIKSAPNSNTPGKLLEDIFNNVFKSIRKKHLSILDFGAGKLRNTLYLLEQKEKYTLTAVEFEELKLKDESEQMRNNLAKAETKFGKRFRRLVYPDQFIKSRDRVYDLVILINVMNIMPVPSERLFALGQCFEKLKSKGHLLWYSSYGQTTYKERFTEDVRIADGYYTHEKDYIKAFFREYKDDEEIDELLFANGFKFIEKFPVSNSKARLYQKTENCLLPKVLSMKRIKEGVVADKTIKDPIQVQPRIVEMTRKIQERIPNPESLGLESLYAKLLDKIPTGQEKASEYQRLVFLVLGRLFRPHLQDFEIEKEINEGRKRIDIVATNKSNSGFWSRIATSHKVHCPYIMFECKNYENDPKNPEFDQLQGRLNEKRGMIGFLVYRSSKNKPRLLKTCRDIMNSDQKYILLLDDNDLIVMLKLHSKGLDDDIDDMMEQKWKEFFFETKK